MLLDRTKFLIPKLLAAPARQVQVPPSDEVIYLSVVTVCISRRHVVTETYVCEPPKWSL